MDNRTFNIGRDETCEIVINDNQGVVSRKHAILKALPFGRYEIIDVSKNGTSVNGKKIRPHKAVRVKRSDVITFANTYKMDWNDVPHQRSVTMIAAYCLAGLIVVILLIVGLKALIGGTNDDSSSIAEPAVEKSEQAEETPKADESKVSTPFGEAIIGTENQGVDEVETPKTGKSRHKEGTERKSQQASNSKAENKRAVTGENTEDQKNTQKGISSPETQKQRKKSTGGDK